MIYTYLDDFAAWLRRVWQGKPRTAPAAPARAGAGRPSAAERPAPAEASAE
ncbi:hypothetical protein CBM2634_A220002 [Cupriavidus taiwanensis]|uniref:Uncharacterized protein n=1 Tax=Cupriavidus taiwanensis TaxID=164546 RepID=A0A375IZR4_9BURK|nr:hypothetical protein CBM2634_A220002 [Cupriavidus taiwanensis]